MFFLSLSLCLRSPKLQPSIVAIILYFSVFNIFKDFFVSSFNFEILLFCRFSYPLKSALSISSGLISAASTSCRLSLSPRLSSLSACGKDSSGSPSISTGIILSSPCKLLKVSISFWHQSDKGVLFEHMTIRYLLVSSASSMEAPRSLAASSSLSRNTLKIGFLPSS